MRTTVENIRFWRSVCLCWQKSTGRVEADSSRISRALWLLNFLLHATHVTFLFVRYVQFNHLNKSAQPSTKVYTEYAVVAYTIPVMLHICMYFRLPDLVDFLNEYSKFYSSVEGKNCHV